MQSLICDVMALQPTISTTESIRRLMQPSWPWAHETIRQHTERQCHCRQAEHMVAPTNPLANSEPSTQQRSKPIDAVDQCPLLTQSGHRQLRPFDSDQIGIGFGGVSQTRKASVRMAHA